MMTQEERAYIVASLSIVDGCFIVDTLDKNQIHDILPFNEIYIGSDWVGNRRWLETEKSLEPLGSKVVYLPHTDGISSTLIRSYLNK